MATFFRNKLQSGVGTSEIEVVAVGTTSRVTIIGMSVTNLTESVVLASIRVENTTLSTPNSSAYYIKEVPVAPNQSLRVINGGEKLVLAGDMKVYIQSNTANSLDFIASFVEIQ
jgi:hypothetical protein